jgi:hypothetical protein
MTARNEGFVEIERDGRTFKGEWRVDRGLITVRYVMREKTTQLGSETYPPEQLARQLLSELVDE